MAQIRIGLGMPWPDRKTLPYVVMAPKTGSTCPDFFQPVVFTDTCKEAENFLSHLFHNGGKIGDHIVLLRVQTGDIQ